VAVEDADFLQNLIEQQQTVTSQHERDVQLQVAKFAALRESDRAYLKRIKNWPADRDYIIDPLGERICEAFADFLYGEDPVFTAAANDSANPKAAEDETTPGERSEGPEPTENAPKSEVGDDDKSVDDQDRLDDIVDANNLPTELHSAVSMFIAEAEAWWRIYRDDQQSDFPILEWHSRAHVRPVFRGRKLIAAAFVSDLWQETINDNLITYKYVEIQTENYVRNLLYKGVNNLLGQSIALTERPETAELPEEWSHDLGMLAGRIAGKFGRDRRYAISKLHGVEDLLFSLNEATTIGHENARLTLKRRLAVPREAINAKTGKFDAGEDVLVMDDPLDEELGGSKGQGKFAVLEYSFDAPALISYKNDTSSTILTRVGLARQLTDPNNNEGGAASGTALRVRLIPTTMAAKGVSRPWDDDSPSIIMKLQLLDALPKNKGGFGRSWQKPGEPPIIERADPLPVDETEETNRHAVAVSSEFESRETAIKSLHPDWTDQQVQGELDKVFSELATFQSIGSGGAGGAAGPPPPPGTPGNGAPNDAAALAASIQTADGGGGASTATPAANGAGGVGQ
jgi:hypothetical protein